MKIGLFGGTFDPIHNGHLHLARCIKEDCQLDLVLFSPAAISPLKQGTQPTPVQHRLKMVELAIQGIPGFKLLDWEAKRPPPSYTIDTLRALKEQDQQAGVENSYYLILGQDSVATFPQWKSFREILHLASLRIGRRETGEPLLPDNAPEWLKRAVEQGTISTPIVEVSGTEVRRRLKEGGDCKGLLPQKVLDYIQDHKLY